MQVHYETLGKAGHQNWQQLVADGALSQSNGRLYWLRAAADSDRWSRLFRLLWVLSVSLATPPSPFVHGGPQRNGEISRAALIKIQYISVFPTLDVRVRRTSVSLQQTAASLDVYCVLMGGGRDCNNVATEIRKRACYTVTAIPSTGL